MKRKDWTWPAVILLSTGGVIGLTFADLRSPVRIPLVFWFALVCPGMAFAQLLSLADRLATFLVAVTVSLVLDGLTAISMLYLGAWSPKNGLLVLSLFCLAGILLQARVSFQRMQAASVLRKNKYHRHKKRRAE